MVTPLSDWISKIIDALGPAGVGVLVALENIIPPIPSELVLPLGGFRAREGTMNVFLVWLCATVGAYVGALALYWLGAWLGYDRVYRLAGHKRFILASQKDIERGSALFDRYGSWVIALGRCVPVVRSIVSLPAGMRRMPLVKFSALTLSGTAVWNAAFIGAGWALAERWQRVDRYMGPVSLVVVGVLLVGLGVLAWRRRHN
jgi:membrane protein DedA with SNARE-associated domain